MNNQYSARPFIKWAGGKGQLLPQLLSAFPNKLYDDCFTYVEPFVGGGAMLFFLLQKFPNIKRAIINDVNYVLTDAYSVIKDSPESLISNLKSIETEYKSLSGEEARKEFYIMMRTMFNTGNLSKTEKTSLLIFLNKTCFNGLYRENSKGEFNVPFGRYENPIICNEDVINADSFLLNKYDVQIMTGDFSLTFDCVKSDTDSVFFYFDPPYRPISATSNFNSYVKDGFNDDKQCELARFCHQLSARRNFYWMLSNSDCSASNPQDKFFEKLYHGFDIMRVQAMRSINSNAIKRGRLTELLVRNY
ncbi:MAG: DNA adenine methylase [Prevotella sp.]